MKISDSSDTLSLSQSYFTHPTLIGSEVGFPSALSMSKDYEWSMVLLQNVEAFEASLVPLEVEVMTLATPFEEFPSDLLN